jgi:hypothetical protein
MDSLGSWDAFNIAPASKTLCPTAAKVIHGSVLAPCDLVLGTNSKVAAASLQGYSWVTLDDFGKEVHAARNMFLR